MYLHGKYREDFVSLNILLSLYVCSHNWVCNMAMRMSVTPTQISYTHLIIHAKIIFF